MQPDAQPRPAADVRVGVILAGGDSRRMGRNKAMAKLAGQTLASHVHQRLAPQVDLVLVSGPGNCGLAATAIPDRADGPAGPAAGLWAVLHWLRSQPTACRGFLSVPVDGPFLPLDLYRQLASSNSTTVARTEQGLQPTFAFWRLDQLAAALDGCAPGTGVSLHALARACAARELFIADAQSLRNINTPVDLAAAQTS